MKLGGIVQINYGSTRDWALVKKDAGFSGNHWIFIPNKPLDKSKPLIKKRIAKVSIPKLNRIFNVVAENFTDAVKPELSFLNLQQLEAVSIKTMETLAEAKILLSYSKQFSQKELINDIQLANLFETTKTYYHRLTNRVEQIKQFRAVCLGEERCFVTTSKAFQDALNEQEPIEETTPEIVVDNDTGIILLEVVTRQSNHMRH